MVLPIRRRRPIWLFNRRGLGIATRTSRERRGLDFFLFLFFIPRIWLTRGQGNRSRLVRGSGGGGGARHESGQRRCRVGRGWTTWLGGYTPHRQRRTYYIARCPNRKRGWCRYRRFGFMVRFVVLLPARAIPHFDVISRDEAEISIVADKDPVGVGCIEDGQLRILGKRQLLIGLASVFVQGAGLPAGLGLDGEFRSAGCTASHGDVQTRRRHVPPRRNY